MCREISAGKRRRLTHAMFTASVTNLCADRHRGLHVRHWSLWIDRGSGDQGHIVGVNNLSLKALRWMRRGQASTFFHS